MELSKFINVLQSFQLLQGALAILIFIISHFIGKILWKKNVKNKLKEKNSALRRFITPLINYAVFLTLYLPSSLIIKHFSEQPSAVNSTIQLSVFFLLSHYVYLISKSKRLYIASFVILCTFWYFNIINLLKPSLIFLDQYSITIANFKISPSLFIKSLGIILGFIWLTNLASDQLKNTIKNIKTLRGGTKEILLKAVDFSLYVIAGLIVLNILGIDLSTLAVFGGALGVGIGFGLQKITSNFISGLILLVERSIEIDDLIEIQGNEFGYIRKLGSRYTLLETYDGKEILIPNEDFITNKVINWTFSNKKGRIEINVGVSYDTDIKLVKTLMLQAANEHPRCLKDPSASCMLVQFADFSVNFKLHFFVEDVTEGRIETQSDVMFAIWDKFKAHNIEIPYPQRDVHIKSN
jgi:small-conductance mechanosensitive channel